MKAKAAETFAQFLLFPPFSPSLSLLCEIYVLAETLKHLSVPVSSAHLFIRRERESGKERVRGEGEMLRKAPCSPFNLVSLLFARQPIPLRAAMNISSAWPRP